MKNEYEIVIRLVNAILVHAVESSCRQITIHYGSEHIHVEYVGAPSPNPAPFDNINIYFASFLQSRFKEMMQGQRVGDEYHGTAYMEHAGKPYRLVAVVPVFRGNIHLHVTPESSPNPPRSTEA